jgi:hypothetical protein
LRYVQASGHANVRVAVFIPDPDDPAPTGPLPAGPRPAGPLPAGPPAPGSVPAGLAVTMPQPVAPPSQRGDELGTAFRRSDLLLTVAELDPASGADYLATWATDAVAIITAGHTHGTHAHAVGEMLRLSGVRLNSSVVVGADDADDSLGLETVPPERVAGQL